MNALVLLAVLLSPPSPAEAPAAGVAGQEWRALYEDGRVVAHAGALALSQLPEPSTPVGVWGWSPAHAPRRLEKPQSVAALGPEDATRLEVRVTRPRPGGAAEPLRPLRLIAAPLAMWQELPEQALPGWPVPDSGRISLPCHKAEPWRFRVVGRGEGSWWVDLAPGRQRAEVVVVAANGLDLLLTGPDTAPVDAARVDLFDDGTSPGTSVWAMARSERGRVRFDGLPDRRSLRVEVDPRDDLAPATVRGLPSELPRVFALRRGATLTGRLVDERGDPIASGEVGVETWLAGASATLFRARAQSGGDGGWKLVGFPVGRAAVSFRGPGRVSLGRQLELREGVNDLGTEVLPRGVELTVRVEGDDGVAVAGATVKGGSQAEARSDARGLARLAGLPLAPVELRGRADRFLEAKLRVNPPFPGEVRLVLPRAFTIEGRAVDAAGIPLPDARLRVEQRACARELEVAGDGRFALDLQTGERATLELGAPATVSERWPIEAGAPGEWRDLGDLALGAGLAVAGRVVDAGTGEPVAGATLWSPRPSPFGPAVAWAASEVTRAASDLEGRFRITGLRPGPLMLRVDAAGYARSHLELTLASPEAAAEEASGARAGATADAGEIALVRGSTLQVRVEPEPDAERDAPLEARVDLRGQWHEPDFLHAEVREGLATFRHLPPGRVAVAVLAGPRLLCERAVTVPEKESLLDVDCSRDGLEVVGTVRVGGERVGPGTLAWSRGLAPSAGRIDNRLSPGGLRQQQVVGAGRPAVHVAVLGDGSFRSRQLTPGTWAVHWTAGEGALSPSLTVEIPATERFETELVFPGAALSGVVVDADGEGVAGARVGELTSGAFALTRDNGEFVLAGLEPGRFAVQARARELASEVVEGELVAEQPAAPLRLVLGEPRPSRLEVHVRDAGEGPAAGAFVFLEEEGKGARILTADRDGTAVAEIVPPWAQRFRVAATTGSAWVTTGWTAREQAREGITLVLGTGMLVVRSEAVGRPHLFTPTGWDLCALLAQLGVAPGLTPDAPWALAGLPAGRYRLVVGDLEREVTIDDGATAVMDLTE